MIAKCMRCSWEGHTKQLRRPVGRCPACDGDDVEVTRDIEVVVAPAAAPFKVTLGDVIREHQKAQAEHD